MMTLTEKDYEGYYWPELKTAIDQLLNMKPGAYIPISYEQMYRYVFVCFLIVQVGPFIYCFVFVYAFGENNKSYT